MPGMMDTILNLGLNDEVCEGLARLTANPRFAYDSYRRFIQMFSDVVMDIPKHSFEVIIDKMKDEKGVKFDNELDADDKKKLCLLFKEYYKSKKGTDFPTDPRTQLVEAIKAVFRSWDNPRAIYYRRQNDIPNNWGTAVNVQSMVYGNMGDDSGTGVAFTRDPSTGEKRLYGEFLMNAQGEDVVAGIRTPQPISQLEKAMPDVYRQFVDISNTLENTYKDMQDMEFTIEKGRLYMLQTRNGKRTAPAALRIAVELVGEGMVTKQEALMKIDAKQLDTLLHPQFDQAALKKATPVSSGLPASPGAACGRICLDTEAVLKNSEAGEKSILIRLETSPEDIEGMAHSEGILTARGGMTSHAAVVARGMGTCCIAGCGDLSFDMAARTVAIKGKTLKEGEFISLDGTAGNIYIGSIPTVEAELSGDFATIMLWADDNRTMKVRTNADSPADAETAVKFGAEGIGLCRTEHMFFGADRIFAMREMILAQDTAAREKALAKLLPMQRDDFAGIFRAMASRPVTIRLLDPPLHEFLPNRDQDIKQLADEMKIDVDRLKAVIAGLHEINPMLGHRGCRLAVSYPEIAVMQTRAIMEAAIDVTAAGVPTVPEIMIPLVGEAKELKFVKNIVIETAEKVITEKGRKIDYLVGTMIEVPRACLTADAVAAEADFFSFGTNDLTQMTYGLSRDDAGKILEDYFQKKIFEADPTARLDQDGVGKLIDIAVKLGRGVKPGLKIGICGEHGGDPSSITFCYGLGFDYVSCSPFRVPIARLSAAQAKIMADK